MALNLSSIFIYFGFTKAGTRCLNEARHLAYCNNDKETLHIIQLWMSNIINIDIPPRKDTPSEVASMSSSMRSVKQKLQLQSIKNKLIDGGISLKDCLSRINNWILPNETAELPPFLSSLLIKECSICILLSPFVTIELNWNLTRRMFTRLLDIHF